jgi:hypothetical protein
MLAGYLSKNNEEDPKQTVCINIRDDFQTNNFQSQYQKYRGEASSLNMFFFVFLPPLPFLSVYLFDGWLLILFLLLSMCF